MSDDLNNETQDNEEESFAELLESYSFGMKDDLQIGDKITAKIISIGENTVFMDAGTKVDGIVERAELLDDEGNMLFSEGDEFDLYVVSLDEHEMRLSKANSIVLFSAWTTTSSRVAADTDNFISPKSTLFSTSLI